MTIQFGLATPWTLASALLGLAAFVALRLEVDILWVVLAGAALGALALR